LRVELRTKQYEIMAKISVKNGQMIDQDHKAYMGLCQMLFNNELNPGQKISYKELAQRINMSTTPVIHALKLLEFKGIVRREPNKGYFVNIISVKEVEEIFDSRIALEISLLPKTVKNINKKNISKLDAALKAHDVAVKSNNNFNRVMTDLRLHMTLATISGTNIQVTLLEGLFDRMLLQYSKDLFFVSLINTSQEEHYAVFEAVKEKDLDTMTETLTFHLTNTKNRIIQGLQRFLDKNDQSPTKYYSFEDIKQKAF
jgi:DNA-binding GntR family transcriptional regulator